MDMLISLIVVIISQSMGTSKHHVVHLKYIQFLFVKYTYHSKAEKKKKNFQERVKYFGIYLARKTQDLYEEIYKISS